jgi:hypothetical protein
MTLKPWNFRAKSNMWTGFGIAVICFAAGSLTTGRLMQVTPVKADSDRVFELRIYHAVPGMLPTMESRFRDTTSKLLAKHNLNVVGYWTGESAPGSDNTFIFLLAHPSLEEAKKNWAAMGKDPGFQQVIQAEQAEKTLEKADVIYMRPTDFSPMK